ncbi:MAG: ornithine carbamoyltransferase [Xanthomonadales bacterium]|nr:ornithine carbamoyltransferase [Xanthomonadales bacterium]
MGDIDPGSIRHFINLGDLPSGTLQAILANAHDLKKRKFAPPQLLSGLSLAMVFDKRSTRTRMSFEVAMKQLGGHTIVMNMDEMQLGGAESVESTAAVLSRYVDAIKIRMSDHALMEELAYHSTIPVINGMTNRSHPCQIMADLLTIEEKLGSIAGKKMAWFGDSNNVSNTFVEAAPIFDFELVLACPEAIHGRVPEGANVTADPMEAARDADVIVTDTWVSMGQEGKSLDLFWPYQVNSQVMARAKDHAIFMHCLPIHEWEEVSEDVAKSPASVIFDEAENRLHAQKAILAWCLENAGVSPHQPGFDFEANSGSP